MNRMSSWRIPGFRGSQAPNQQLFPFPQWAGAAVASDLGNSTFHGLVVSSKTRLNNLLTMNNSYTWSHGIDNASSFFGSSNDFSSPDDSRNLDGERGNSGNDQRHRFINAFVSRRAGRQRQALPERSARNHATGAGRVVPFRNHQHRHRQPVHGLRESGHRLQRLQQLSRTGRIFKAQGRSSSIAVIRTISSIRAISARPIRMHSVRARPRISTPTGVRRPAGSALRRGTPTMGRA